MESGDSLVKEAKNKLKVSSWFGTNTNVVKAGNRYKVDKEWLKAGNAFKSAADCYSNINDQFYNVRYRYMAATEYKRSDFDMYIDCMSKCIYLYKDMDRLENIGKCYGELATEYEENYQYNEALLNYENAIKYYDACNNYQLQIGNIQLKCANLYVRMEDYNKASNTYENASLNMSKYKIDKCCFYSLLCTLLIDNVGAKKLPDKYEQYAQFSSTNEYKIINGVIDAVNDNDIDEFNEVISRYKHILDGVAITLLSRIKSTIIEEKSLA